MSTYFMAPGVPRVKIGVYPKRDGSGSFPREERKVTKADLAAESLAGSRRSNADMSYADFFVLPASSFQADVA